MMSKKALKPLLGASNSFYLFCVRFASSWVRSSKKYIPKIHIFSYLSKKKTNRHDHDLIRPESICPALTGLVWQTVNFSFPKPFLLDDYQKNSTI